jgi:putative transposase
MLERLLKEVKRRMRAVGVFPNETSASTLATETPLWSSEEWVLRRYLTVDALNEVEKPNSQHLRH